MNSTTKKVLKIILWAVASLLILVILLSVSLTIPAVQNVVKNEAINYLKKKTDTEISLERLRITFPSGIELDNFFVSDKKKDTLLYAGKFAVQLDMIALIRSKVNISSVALSKVYANVYRNNPDTVFNYQFLVDSFTSREKEPEPEKKKSAPLSLKLGRIIFDDIRLKYKDDVSGNDAALNMGRLDTKVNRFDLENQLYELDKLELQKTRVQYFQNKPLTVLQQKADSAIDKAEAKAGGKLPLIKVAQFTFDDVGFNYDDRLSNTRAFALLKTFAFKDLFIDLTNGKYQTNNGELSNSVINFAYHPTPSNEQAVNAAADSVKDSPFSLYINKIVLLNNNIKFDNLLAPRAKAGRMDLNHLNIKNLGLSADGIAFDSSGIKATVTGGRLQDTCGFKLSDLKTSFAYDSKQIKVQNLLVKTPNTYIDNNTLVTYSSKDDLSKHPEKVKINLLFRNSVLGLADAYYFVSSIPANYRNEKINLAAALNGYMNDMDIARFNLSGLKNTNVDIAGNIKGLPKIDNTLFNINIGRFTTSKSDITALLSKGTLPNGIELPNQIAAKGNFVGGIKNFKTNLDVKTDMGSAKINATMGGSSKNPAYKADVNLNKFDFGKLLKRNDVGTVSLFLDVAGHGTSAKTANAVVKATVYQAYYNKYNYQNIKLDGKFANQQLALITNSTDTNAHFDINTNINIAGKYPSLSGKIDLKRIDLEKLNFASSEFKIAGLAELDFPTLNPDYLNGNAKISSIQVTNGGKLINVDSISIEALANETQTSLKLKSGIINADLEGKYQLTKIGQAFINEINKYYAFAPFKKIPAQQMRFNVRVSDSKLLKEFVPAIKTFDESIITGSIDTEKDTLIMAAQFPHIIYDSFDVKNVTLDLNNRDSSMLVYNLNIQSLEHPSVQLYNSEISGSAINNVLGVNVFLRDKKRADKYVVGGNFKADNQTYQFSLDPQKLMLNYDKWNVANDNLIQYGKAGIYIKNFDISNRNQLLSVNSTSDQPNAPINVNFKNFKLETLTRFAEQDTSLVGGELNGTVDVKDITQTPQFEANLIVNKLRYQKDQLGDLKIEADNYTPNAYKANVVLSGLHDVRINGYYYTNDKGSLDMAININKFDLKYIESLSGGQLKNGSGILTGQLTAKGPVVSPKVLGNVNFKNAGVNVAQLNSYFRLTNETISFVDNGIRFNNFTLRDSANQALSLNGMIKTNDYKNFGFDLKLRANNFRALNSTSTDNELFYGKVYLTVNANIGGDVNKPEVTGTLRINKDTRFFFAIPESNPGVVNQEGIVEFVDMDAPPNNGRQALNVDSMTKAPLKGVNLSMNLITDKEAEITVVVDPANGDALLVKGEAELNVTMDPSGKLSMTGRYLISDGNYNLSIGGLAKRKFMLQQGSYIQWTGAPTEANINLTAVYNINTSPIDLVASEIQDLPQTTQTTYKQKLPFMVYLKMTDQLLKPKIAFEIDMPENERNAFSGTVYTKLQQVNSNESELNKQVFALLALNRFISDNPFESLSGGTSPEMLARQSVSRLLTQQLNNLAADLIKGVDVSFDLTSEDDYSSGSQQTRTDLSVALSKKLLNDRLTITVGSDFALEGAKSSNSSGSNIAGNVNLEYALSRDGRYRLRAYRRNQNEGIIEGQIVETGLGFALVVDYNKFREVFNSFRKRQRDGENRSKTKNTN